MHLVERYAYDAISVGPSHNYYWGRVEADITSWIAYFIKGMAIACEKVINQMTKAHDQGLPDQNILIRQLDPKQRKVLLLFKEYDIVTNEQLAHILGITTCSSAALCRKWVQQRFLKIVNPSLKARKYALDQPYDKLVY